MALRAFQARVGSSSIPPAATASPMAVATGTRTPRSPIATGPTGTCGGLAALVASKIATTAAPNKAPATDSNGRATQPFNATCSRDRGLRLDVVLHHRGALRLERVDHWPEFGLVAGEVVELVGVLFEIVELILLPAHVDEFQAGRRSVDDGPPHVRVGAVRHVEVDVALLVGAVRALAKVRGHRHSRELAGCWLRNSHQIEQRRHEIDDASLDRNAARRHPWDAENERHAHERLPDLVAVLERDSMLAHRLAVVARECDDRVFPPRLGVHVVEQSTDGVVREPYLAVVRGSHLPSLSLRRIRERRRAFVVYVLGVGVEVMHPEKEAARGRMFGQE